MRDLKGYGRTPPDPKWPGGAKVAVKSNLNLPLAIADKGSLYVAALSAGAGTYTAAGIKLTLGVVYR